MMNRVFDPEATSNKEVQSGSWQGMAGITFFVRPESKDLIQSALADGGYGESLQKGLVALVNEMLAKQNRPPVA
jgi:hypothetical protein